MLNSSQSFVLSSSRNYVCAYHFLPFKSTGNLVVGHFPFCYLFSAPKLCPHPTNKSSKSLKQKGSSTHTMSVFPLHEKNFEPI